MAFRGKRTLTRAVSAVGNNKRVRKFASDVKNKYAPRAPKDVPSAIDAIKRRAVKEGLDFAFDQLHKVATSTGSDNLRVTMNGKTKSFGQVPPPTNGDNREHAKVTMHGPIKLLALGSEKLQVYERSVETGVPTTKTLKGLIKENGKTDYTIFDSKNTSTSDTYNLTRKQLTIGTGFEQRGYTAFGRPTYMITEDIYSKVLDIPPAALPSNVADMRLFASILNSSTEFMFRNQSAYHRAKMKVHLCSYEYKETNGFAQDPIQALADNVGWYDINQISPLPADQKRKIPVYLQYENQGLSLGNSNESNFPSLAWDIDMTNKGSGIKSSPYFRQHYKIVDTQGVVLGPGDFLKYKHTHHYGGGVDVTAVMAENAVPEFRNISQHLHYFYLLEYVGLPCEVTYATGNNTGGIDYDAYIGTSPVILSTEVKKSMSYVNFAMDKVTTTMNTLIPPCHIREFITESNPRRVYGRRDFNLSLKDWSPLAQPPVGKYVIQVASDRTVRAETHAAGNTTATDIQD